MSRIECNREQEVLDAIASARWPDRLGEELGAHVSSCAVCSDLGLIAKAFEEDQRTALGEVRIPSAGLVWWRAELRARQEAVRVASRPITFAQVVAIASMIGIAMVFLSKVEISTGLLDFVSLQPVSLYVVSLAMGLVGVLTSVALYFVLSDE
jgi:hypothetical protein